MIDIIYLKEIKFESIVGLMVEFQLAKLGVRVRFPDDAFLLFKATHNIECIFELFFNRNIYYACLNILLL